MKRVPAPIELRMLRFEISRRALREMTSQQRHFLNLDVTYVHPYSRTTYAKKEIQILTRERRPYFNMASLSIRHKIAALNLRRKKSTKDDVRECDDRAYVRGSSEKAHLHTRRRKPMQTPPSGRRSIASAIQRRTKPYACRILPRCRRILV